jgi:hypothetical protein
MMLGEEVGCVYGSLREGLEELVSQVLKRGIGYTPKPITRATNSYLGASDGADEGDICGCGAGARSGISKPPTSSIYGSCKLI